MTLIRGKGLISCKGSVIVVMRVIFFDAFSDRRRADMLRHHTLQPPGRLVLFRRGDYYTARKVIRSDSALIISQS
jgi:hypothetical protein